MTCVGDNIKMHKTKVLSLNMVLQELQTENNNANQMGSMVYAGNDTLLPTPDLPEFH